MSIHPFQPASPLAADGAALAYVLECAAAQRDDVIRVVGPAGPAAMLWLVKNGFDEAVYARAVGADSRAEPADVLLIPHACSGREAAALLGEAPPVREGGALIIQAAAESRTDGADSLPSWLRSAGLAIEQTLTSKGRVVIIARRQELGGFRQAA